MEIRCTVKTRKMRFGCQKDIITFLDNDIFIPSLLTMVLTLFARSVTWSLKISKHCNKSNLGLISHKLLSLKKHQFCCCANFLAPFFSIGLTINYSQSNLCRCLWIHSLSRFQSKSWVNIDSLSVWIS
jgi:hypothetical protein